MFYSESDLSNASNVNVGYGSTLAASGIPTNGLISLWNAEGDASDAVGNNSGTLINGATTTTAGKIGSAFSLNGTNQYVQVADSASLRAAMAN